MGDNHMSMEITKFKGLKYAKISNMNSQRKNPKFRSKNSKNGTLLRKWLASLPFSASFLILYVSKTTFVRISFHGMVRYIP